MNIESQLMTVVTQLPWLPIVLSIVAANIIGMLWYGPLFGKIWMKLANIKPDPKGKNAGMGRAFLIENLYCIVRNIMFAVLFVLVDPTSFMSAMLLACLVTSAAWTILFSNVAWENMSWKLLFINGSRIWLDLHVAAALLYFLWSKAA